MNQQVNDSTRANDVHFSVEDQGFGKETYIDIGFLAEALIFYGKVHVVGARGVVDLLVHGVGANETLELLKRGNLVLHLRPALPSVITLVGGTARERHDVGF